MKPLEWSQTSGIHTGGRDKRTRIREIHEDQVVNGLQCEEKDFLDNTDRCDLIERRASEKFWTICSSWMDSKRKPVSVCKIKADET